MTPPPTKDQLLATIKTLDASIWHLRISERQIQDWTTQFTGRVASQSDEELAAMGLLSRFTFFGVDEVRVLLRNLHHDLFVYRLVRAYRKANRDSTDVAAITRHVQRELRATQFVGAGNPAESGAHILYYFRQENDLPLTNFSAVESLLSLSKTALAKVRRVVLLDDLCGSGTSAVRFGESIIGRLQDRRAGFKQPPLEVLYLTLCGTEAGIRRVRSSRLYDHVGTSLLLDDTHKVFAPSSRYFPTGDDAPRLSSMSRAEVEAVVAAYGELLYPRHPLGHSNGQLLLGFSHNIPNNSLPIFWVKSSSVPWTPIFRRFGKRYT